jgi:hypothetical protein
MNLGKFIKRSLRNKNKGYGYAFLDSLPYPTTKEKTLIGIINVFFFV